jgi:hypothetical protein
VRRRVTLLLEQIENEVPSPEALGTLRAMEVLEHWGTAEARQILERLAQGIPEARVTREAKEALEQLGKRTEPR